ncbi:MAG: phosphatidylcholine/phosphatidylserine synthase, partial [Planctomycetota bacterium]
VLVAMLHAMGRYGGAEPFWSKLAWVFGMAYACGAVIRLARFNVETASHDEEAHLTFKGLPSPAAAGVIATLTLLQHEFAGTAFGGYLLNSMPFVALAMGYLMVSRFRYAHVANRYLKGRKPAEYLTGAVFGALLAFLFPEISAAVIFCGFALSGPVMGFKTWLLTGYEEEPERADLGEDSDLGAPLSEESDLAPSLDDSDDAPVAGAPSDAAADARA